ncbi:hypothetical protein QWZ06_14420 [Chryseobacterium tructae]|uniref:TonB C-terminal domain-containing protein n=1 Tax=Chryseobacterium tructae TaxID=1037380 RepID=A0ABV7XXC5_9FLAO|nr:hypothetical protein [Chryseobacterium tructae]MDN3693395.1 hypothetical protein [Chryseobacterium tructae]
MKTFLLIITVASSIFVKSQVTNHPPAGKASSIEEKIYGNKKPYEQAEIIPQFKGEITKFKKLLLEKLDLKKFNNNNTFYFSELSFIIEKDGSVSSIKAEGDEKDFNTEVINGFKKMRTEWIAAGMGNWKVRYHVSVPVSHSNDQLGKGTNNPYNFFGNKRISTLEVFESVEQKAFYQKGIENFKNIILSKIGTLADSYPFTMSFVVERDGLCSGVKISGTDEDKNEKIKRAILPIKEIWIPAKISGQAVRCKYGIDFH